MMRMLQIVVVLMVVLSVAYVLITPDPTDDVDGILRPNQLLTGNHLLKAHSVIGDSAPQFEMLTIVLAHASTDATFHKCLTTSELLDLTCVCRC